MERKRKELEKGNKMGRERKRTTKRKIKKGKLEKGREGKGNGSMRKMGKKEGRQKEKIESPWAAVGGCCWELLCNRKPQKNLSSTGPAIIKSP